VVESTGSQLGEVAVEVGALITQAEERSRETAQLKKEYASTLAEIALEKDRLQEQHAENEKTIAMMRAGIAEIQNKPPPSIPLQHVMNALEAPMKKMLQDDITTLIDSFREEMEALVQSRNEDYQSLWEKLGVTEKMVGAIARQVEREQAGLAGPVKAITSASS